MQVTNGNVTLNVAESGDPAAPPILLLHGITGSGGTWGWLVPTLAQRFRVLQLDFRGHGGSDRVPGEYTADGYVGDAIAALEQAARQPCVAIGHSLGGVTVAAVAQRRPDLLTGAIMEDPPLTLPRPSTDGGAAGPLIDGFGIMRESIPRLQAAQIERDALAAMLALAPDTGGGSTFGEVLFPDAIAAMADALLALDASVLDPVLTGTAGTFLGADTPFGVPALIITADPARPDAVANPDRARRYASISPDLEVVTIDGAGHLIHDERATRDRFRSLVLGFLDRVAPA